MRAISQKLPQATLATVLLVGFLTTSCDRQSQLPPPSTVPEVAVETVQAAEAGQIEDDQSETEDGDHQQRGLGNSEGEGGAEVLQRLAIVADHDRLPVRHDQRIAARGRHHRLDLADGP